MESLSSQTTRERIQAVLATHDELSTTEIAQRAGVNYNTARAIIGKLRAEAGTSKHKSGQTAKVLAVLKASKQPLTTRQLAERSGVNHNTVRGVLIRLRRDGKLP